MQNNEEQKIEITKTDTTIGTVQPSLKYPAPAKMKRIIKALNYFSVSLITMVSATDLFTARQSKIIVFVLGVFILLLGAIELGTGVKPFEDDGKSYRNTIGRTLILVLFVSLLLFSCYS